MRLLFISFFLLNPNDEPWILTQPMDPEKKSLNFIFPTKYVIPNSLKFSHWPSEDLNDFSIEKLGGGFNPFQKYQSNWIISPGKGLKKHI